jgi:Family of unknown function (DUF5681)
MPFMRGQSGHPGGRPKDKPFAEALRMEIKGAGDDHRALRKVARALLDKAAEGDIQAIREVADRLDGKLGPPDSAGDGGARQSLHQHGHHPDRRWRICTGRKRRAVALLESGG